MRRLKSKRQGKEEAKTDKKKRVQKAKNYKW
jgi:hypothetical protein